MFVHCVIIVIIIMRIWFWNTTTLFSVGAYGVGFRHGHLQLQSFFVVVWCIVLASCVLSLHNGFNLDSLVSVLLPNVQFLHLINVSKNLLGPNSGDAYSPLIASPLP